MEKFSCKKENKGSLGKSHSKDNHGYDNSDAPKQKQKDPSGFPERVELKAHQT